MIGAKRKAEVCLEGNAIRHLPTLHRHGVRDAIRMSGTGNRLEIDVPEAEFRITLTEVTGATRADFTAVFKEAKPDGGTWWSHWRIAVPGPPSASRVTRAITAEIRNSRIRFARALTDLAQDDQDAPCSTTVSWRGFRSPTELTPDQVVIPPAG